MSDIKKMKITYLNVNGFAGKENKKNSKTTSYEEIAEKIRTKDADMIFLSEINSKSENLDNFLKKINEKKDEKYVILAPSDEYGELNKIPGSSCTICLKKEGLQYTNKGNGFNPSNKPNGDYLQFCKIVSGINKEVTVLIGIHWAVGSDKQTKELDVSRTADFILSLKRLLTFTLGKKVNAILFGDTNANPDVDLEKAVEEKETTKIEAYINNYIFEHLMNELGLHEIVPEGKPYTFIGKTRIDRVFTNMPKDKVKVKVDQEFLKEDKDSLSDHAALVITYEEV